VGSVSEIGGMGGVRWEDQQKIHSLVSGDVGASSGDVEMADDGEIRADLKVEYAKSNRSSCFHCKSNIDKGIPRIATRGATDDENDGRLFEVDRWHHVECFIEILPQINAVGISPLQLNGFGSLLMETQRELLDSFSSQPKAVAGKKRKGKSDKGVSKKGKVEDPEEKALKEQSKLIWQIRDQLQANLTQVELKEMLQGNYGYRAGRFKGESQLLDGCADGMTFGVIGQCDSCNGTLIPHTYNYRCTGNISEWTKCTNTTTEVYRSKWTIPKSLRDDYGFLKAYKYVARERKFPKAPPTTTPTLSSLASTSSQSTIKEDPSKPLNGFTIFIIGRLSKTKAALTKEINELGGDAVGSVDEDTTLCISNQAEIDKQSKNMNKVMECDVPVVPVDYLKDAAKGGALGKIAVHKISSWGASRDALPVATPGPSGSQLEEKLYESVAQKRKLTMKGGSVVDPDSGLEDTHHVYESSGVIYNAVLGMVDIVRGTNSYYKLQLLEGDKRADYCLFRAWGRVGTTIGGNKLESFDSDVEDALDEFMRLYEEKTGTSWYDRKHATKIPGKFYPLEIDYGGDDDASLVLSSAGSKSKLAPEIQDFIKMIFDIETMKKALKEFEIDMKKMPLGKLSKNQIKSAYSVLNQCLRELGRSSPDRSLLLDYSNKFYTLIPHDFGLQKPPLLETEEMIKGKTLMLDNLLEIELAYSLLKSDSSKDGEEKDPLDIHYEKLKTDMEVLPEDSEEYQRLVEYVANTHASTHSSYKLEVMEIFKISRHGESKRYKPFSKLPNRMLLWHGSRLTNYVGILSQGLRIAPPEAPVTGYMFGKGVYFADMVSKSANYCRTSRSDPIGIMILCEVALGNMYERQHAEFITDLPPGKHSTKGVGSTAPDPDCDYVTESGVVIPMGNGVLDLTMRTSLLYNEYIVYDVSQINMKYLLKMNFEY
jgi:poly [ADP-ribose] polymerase